MSVFSVVGLFMVVLVTFAVGLGTNSAATMATIVFFPAVIALYFAPAINANLRKHPSATAVSVLNLLLGWTVLGWIGALVWSYGGADAREQASVTPAPTPVPAPTPAAAPASDMRDCPFCAEPIKAAAIKCKHCGSEVTPLV